MWREAPALPRPSHRDVSGLQARELSQIRGYEPTNRFAACVDAYATSALREAAPAQGSSW